MFEKNVARTFQFPGLKNTDNTFADEPSLSTGDVQISKDGSAFTNIGTLPTTLAGTPVLSVALTASELNCDTIVIRFAVSGLLTAYITINTQTTRDEINAISTTISEAAQRRKLRAF